MYLENFLWNATKTHGRLINIGSDNSLLPFSKDLITGEVKYKSLNSISIYSNTSVLFCIENDIETWKQWSSFDLEKLSLYPIFLAACYP